MIRGCCMPRVPRISDTILNSAMGLENILIVDDEMIIRHSLQEMLRRLRYKVAVAESLEEAEGKLKGDGFDVVFLDLRLPDGVGTDFLECLMCQPEPPIVIMITGYGSVESAVECMRAGAFDYVLKPLAIDHVKAILKKAENYNQMARLNRYYSSESDTRGSLLGESRPMRHLKTLIRKVASTEATVLVTGENGTGKELAAREIYQLSERANQPYIRVNCAAVSENLIESEFFGHERGAFTGATERREGRFELANRGTILLDEIGEISPAVQVKLLRVLQEQEFERVGGNTTIQVDVRVVATTNRNLREAAGKGDFREDLYYRLNVFPLHIPALRERKEDIPLLAHAFLERLSRKHGIHPRGFSRSALELMDLYPWPGNVRELQNTLERAVILGGNGKPIEPEHLCLPVQQAGGSLRRLQPPMPGVNHAVPSSPSAVEEAPAKEAGSPPESESPAAPGGTGTAPIPTLKAMEREHILKALEESGGNRKAASDMLGISDRTLRSKLQKFREEGIAVD